jgi:hypothetical protein
LVAAPHNIIAASGGRDVCCRFALEEFGKLDGGAANQIWPPGCGRVLLGIGGERVGYRDPSGMTVAEVWLVLSPEIAFEGFFSFAAIVRSRACPDLASCVEDDPLSGAVSTLSEV